jgi:hypothetical protein
MATTFTLIDSYSVGAGGIASIDFTSIPNTYTDLCLKTSLRATADTVSAYLTFNGDSSNRTNRMLYGLGSGSGASEPGTTIYAYGNVNASARTSNTFCNADYYIPNYAGSTYKSLSIDAAEENNGTLAFCSIVASLWSSTSAINRITLTSGLGNFAQYSTAYLYGVKNA